MSTATIPTSSGLPRSHGSDENRGRGRIAGKVRSRGTQLHVRSVNAAENPITTHPGKSVNTGSIPLTTPRKALSRIDQNSSVPSATPSQKGVGGPLPQTSSKKSGRKQVPLGSGVKSKQYGSGGKRAAKSDTGSEKASEIESEIFPDIETMSRKEEPDEMDSGRQFVPPAYFDNLVAALKKPPLPPSLGEFPPTSALSSLKLEPETALRPVSLNTVSPSLYPPHEEDLILPVDLPDLDFL